MAIWIDREFIELVETANRPMEGVQTAERLPEL
jgi:hypothetical protein